MLIQLAAIALAASGVALSANFPQPPQRLAVHEMLIAQFVGSAMFLALLFRAGWRAWVGMVISAGPMLIVAAWLARMPLSRVMIAWGEVGLWLTALALWSAVARDEARDAQAPGMRSRGLLSVVAALAVLLSAGGLLAWFLRADARRDLDWNLLRLFPLIEALRGLDRPAEIPPLLSTTACSAVALVILAAKRLHRR